MRTSEYLVHKDLGQGNIQEEVKKKRRHHHRKHQKRAGFYIFLGAFMVLIAVTIYCLVNPTVVDGYKRDILYHKMERDANGNLPLYSFNSEQSTVYAEFNGCLLTACQSKITLVEEYGDQIYTASTAILNPTLIHNEDYGLCYDLGGTHVSLYDRHGQMYEITIEGEILDAYLSENGDSAITYKRSGYKSCVSILDKKGALRYEFQSAQRFCMASCCSAKHKILASVTLGQDDGKFISYVVLYKTDATESFATIPIEGSLVYDIGLVDDVFCAVGEDGLTFISQSGEILSTYSYGIRYLRSCNLSGNGYATVYMSDYKAGAQGILVTVDKHGNEIGGFAINDEVIWLDCAGNYIGLLDNTRVTVFDKNLERVATQEAIASVERVNMRREGTAILISTTKGTLFVP